MTKFKWGFYVSLLLLLSACTTAAEVTPEPSATPSPPPTLTPSSTPTETPTPQPTPIGSGGYPLLAVMVKNSDSCKVQIIELISERLVAELPVPVCGRSMETVKFSPDGTKLLYNIGDSRIYIYPIRTGYREQLNTKHLSEQFGGFARVEEIRWSPSQEWLSVKAEIADRSRMFLFNLETERAIFVSSGYWARWHPHEDVLIYQNMGGSIMLFDAEMGRETLRPGVALSLVFRLADRHVVRPNNAQCSRCYYPEYGNMQEVLASNNQSGHTFYHLFDIETKTEAVFVAQLNPPPDTEYQASVLSLLPIPSRGDYLAFISEGIGSWQDRKWNFFTAWNTNGELPIELSAENEAGKLFNVMPIALSPDESTFLGYVFETEYPHKFTRVVIVNISTREVLYQYRLRNSVAAVYPGSPWVGPEDPTGIDVFWPDK